MKPGNLYAINSGPYIGKALALCKIKGPSYKFLLLDGNNHKCVNLKERDVLLALGNRGQALLPVVEQQMARPVIEFVEHLNNDYVQLFRDQYDKEFKSDKQVILSL